jgi:hypothetical protein
MRVKMMLMQEFSFLEELGFKLKPSDMDSVVVYVASDLRVAIIDNDDKVTVEILPIIESHRGEWQNILDATGWSVDDEGLPQALKRYLTMPDRPTLEQQEFVPLLFFTQAETIFAFLVDDYGLTYDNPIYGFNHRNGHSLYYTDKDARHVSIVFAAGQASAQIKWDGADYNIERDIDYDDSLLESLADEVERLLLKSS